MTLWAEWCGRFDMDEEIKRPVWNGSFDAAFRETLDRHRDWMEEQFKKNMSIPLDLLRRSR